MELFHAFLEQKLRERVEPKTIEDFMLKEIEQNEAVFGSDRDMDSEAVQGLRRDLVHEILQALLVGMEGEGSMRALMSMTTALEKQREVKPVCEDEEEIDVAAAGVVRSICAKIEACIVILLTDACYENEAVRAEVLEGSGMESAKEYLIKDFIGDRIDEYLEQNRS